MLRGLRLQQKERVVGVDRPPRGRNGGGKRLHTLHPEAFIAESGIAEPQRIESQGQIRHRLVGERAHDALEEGAVK